MNFYIDVLDSNNVKQGSGPITSASGWRYTARMDKAGVFRFQMPASDPKAASILKKYIVRAYAYLDGAYVEVGAGIIDHIERQVQDDGTVRLVVSGDDLIRELTYRSVHNLKLESGGNPISHAAAVALVDAVLTDPLDDWVFTPDASPPNDSIYGYFMGETVLQAAIKVAEKSQTHFYRGEGRSLIFDSVFSPSSQRAIQARSELSAFNCAITDLTERIDTYDLITRIYPRGSGNANVQLTMRASDRVAPLGFTLNTTGNYIEYNQGTTDYGRIERQVDFRDIGPIANTNADIVAAANALYDAALEYLRRHSTELEQATYTVKLVGCRTLLRPMQSIRVVYKDSLADLDIDADLNILEATIQVDNDEIYTTDLVVSNADRWPKTDVGTIVDGIAEGHVYQALQQLSANSYVTAYNKNIDRDHSATFRFRFGNEVTQLQQVLFEFQLLEFESTVRSLGTPTTSSEEAAAVAGTTEGGSTHSHTVTIAAHTHPVPDHQHTFTIIGNGAGALTNQIGYGAGGTAGGMRHNINLTDHVVSTNASSGATTASSGGGSAPTSSNESSHTHNVTIPAHDHDIALEIVADYGIFREDAANTYEIEELEYQINGGAWADLDGASDADDGWWALDITSQVQNATTFRPLHENNELVIRAKEGYTLVDWFGVTTDVMSIETSVGTTFELGDFILISDAPLSDTSVDINGIWEIITPTSTFAFHVQRSGMGAVGNGAGGTASFDHTVTIDAQLSVRSVIQAILYGS